MSRIIGIQNGKPVRSRNPSPQRKRVNDFGLTLRERHPYIIAEQLFTAGRIPVAQAVGMMCSDLEFTAECELAGKDKAATAEAIVRNTWARRLLETSNG